MTTAPFVSLTPRRAVVLFLAFAFAYFLSTLIRAVTATLAPTLVQEFALSAGDLGLLAGGYFFGFALTQLPLGSWLDRLGPKRVVLGFLCVAVLACLAFARASGFVELLIARMLCGVGVSACLMAPLTSYRRWYAPGAQMRASSWMLMTGALGMVASTLPVQWLLPLIGWRGLFLILGALLALSMVLIAWQVPGEPAPPIPPEPTRADAPLHAVPLDTVAAPQPADPLKASGYAAVWRDPYFRSLAPFGFVGYGGMVAIQTLWAAPWLVNVAGFTPVAASTAMFWLNVSMMLAFLVWGWVNPWLARKGLRAEQLMAWGLPVHMALLVFMAVSGAWVGDYSGIVWTLFCVSGTVGTLAQPAIGMAFPPALAGRALSAFNLLIFSGVFAVQWGVGLLVDGLRSLGWSVTLAYQGAMGIFALCLLWTYVHLLRAKKR
jgi:predicted MFS family arabinose efflux permease